MRGFRVMRGLGLAIVLLFLIAGIFLNPKPARAETDPETFQIKARLVWDGGGPKPAVQLQLKYQETPDGPELDYGGPVTLVTTEADPSPSYTWDIPLPQSAVTFNVYQVGTPEGYQQQGKYYDAASETWVLTNKFINKKDVVATLYWEGGPDSKPDVFLQLYAGAQPVASQKASDPVLVSAPGAEPRIWIATATFTDRLVYDTNNNLIQYWSNPLGVPTYHMLKTPDPQDLESALVYVPITKQVNVTKLWIGGPENKPAAVLHLQLKSNGAVVRQYDKTLSDPVEITAPGDTVRKWEEKYTFIADVSGLSSYLFTLTEDKVTDYSSKITGNWVAGFTITNTYTIPKGSITATKVWNDAFEEHPAIRLQLYRNEAEFGEEVTVNGGAWKYIWTGLELTDANGVPYDFTVDEMNVPENYTKTVSGSAENGFLITNNYQAPPEQTYTVTYHPNGGTGTLPVDTNRYTKGQAVKVLPGGGLTKWGSVFAGWALSDGTRVTDPFIMPDRDVTFFAIWEPEPYVTPSPSPEIPLGAPLTGGNSGSGPMAVLCIALALGIIGGMASLTKRQKGKAE